MVCCTVWAGTMAGLLLALAACGAGADCVPIAAGQDTSHWNRSAGTFLGKALGQTFYAPDTLITRITAWRHPNNIGYEIGVRLFVTTVDTVNYDPPKPITTGILQDGPIVNVRDSDPPGLPIRMDFVLYPPLALPHPGTYAFFLQREGCDAGETRLIMKEPGDYAYGTFWITGRTSFLPCFLRSVDSWLNLDLCFEVEFCRDTTTPVRGVSWGRVKVIYR